MKWRKRDPCLHQDIPTSSCRTRRVETCSELTERRTMGGGVCVYVIDARRSNAVKVDGQTFIVKMISILSSSSCCCCLHSPDANLKNAQNYFLAVYICIYINVYHALLYLFISLIVSLRLWSSVCSSGGSVDVSYLPLSRGLWVRISRKACWLT